MSAGKHHDLTLCFWMGWFAGAVTIGIIWAFSR